MTLPEANAFLAILLIATKAALIIRDNYRLVSKEVRSFPETVKRFEERTAQWKQTLSKYPLQEDHPLWTDLHKAVDALNKAQDDFQALQQSNCCSRWWNKTWFPELWTTLGKDVIDAFDKIVQYLEEKQKMECVAEEEANKVKVPFAFSQDKKYVPIKSTVETIRKSLEDDGPMNNVVLLYGSSGAGKSTLAKYLALDYQGKVKEVSSSSSLCKFFDVVIFISCGKNANSLSVIKKLWVDLGYNLDVRLLPGLEEDGPDRSTKIDQLKRMLISRLENGKTILIILDDVWNSKLIADLMMRLKGVKYLITSQDRKIWLDRVDLVQIEAPNAEEARKILANHIIRWDEDLFPVEVQEEVDGLIGDVQNHPLVLANLATLVKCEKVRDLETWTQMRKGLENAIRAADESNSRPMVFDELYEGKLVASLTMATDLITEKARSLLFLLAICTGDGVDENILKFWFNTLYGPNTFMYNLAHEDLTDRSLMAIKKTEVTWGDALRNVCSIHDLRRGLLREVNATAIHDILQKLTGRHSSSERSEEDLVAALVFIYSDMKDSEDVQSRIRIHNELLRDDGTPEWKENRMLRLKFTKGFARLLHPALDEACVWEKATHDLVKTVILHFLQFLKLKDEAMSELLGIPEAFEAACFALQSHPPELFTWSIPKTLKTLVKNLSNHIRLNMPSQIDLGNLGACLEALYHLQYYAEETTFILVNEPELLILLTELLQFLRKERLSPPEISTAVSTRDLDAVQRLVMNLLGHVVSMRKNRVSAATTPQMMETLLSLLDANLRSSYEFRPFRLEQSAGIFLNLACRDADIKAKAILLPDVLQTLVSLLSVIPKPAVEALQELAWTSTSAERILSYPGALDELLRLLGDGSKGQSEAVRCLGQLASFRSARTVIASKCPTAFSTLIQLLHQNSPPDLLRDIAVAVRKIVSEETEFSRRFLAEFFQRLDLLAADNIGVAVRGGAVDVVEILASEKVICRHLEGYPGLLEQILKFPASSEVNAEYVKHVNSAVKRIFIEGKGLGESRRMTLVARVVKMYTTLLHVDEVESEIKRNVAGGLAIISHKKEFRNVLTDAGAEQIIVIQMRSDPTFYISERGAHVVEDIVFGGTSLTRCVSAVPVAEILDFYLDSFRNGVQIREQENLIRVIASLAYSQEIRKLLAGDRRIDKLLEHVVNNASPVVLECVAKIIYRVCCTEWKEVQREMFPAKTLERYSSLLADGMKSEVQEAATGALVILSSKDEIRMLVSADEKIIDLLVGLLEDHTTSKTLNLVVYLLRDILVTESMLKEKGRIEFMEKALRRLVALLADGISYIVQAGALIALGRLAFRHENGECRVAYPRAANQLASCLRKIEFQAMLEEVWEVVEPASAYRTDTEALHEDMYGLRIYALQCYVTLMEDDTNEPQQEKACICLAKLLCYETNRELFKSVCPTGQACLKRIVNKLYPETAYRAAIALTILDPKEAENLLSLSSFRVLIGGASALLYFKQYKSALDLYNKGIEWITATSGTATSDTWLFCRRGFVKSHLGDVTGALEDLNHAVSVERTAVNLQERGILKISMKDYDGALADLNECFRMDPDDYEVMKYRGYAKFLSGDEDGARFDAQQALSMKFSRSPNTSLLDKLYWGASPITYLEFDL